MVNAIIIDDELKSRELLQELLSSFCPSVKVIGTADAIEPAERLIRSLNPHVIFLDIEMPLGNGFALLQKFNNPSFEVIFTTAYNHYAVKAIKFSALDYLLKPIDIDDLKKAVEKVETKISSKTEDISQRLEVFFSHFKEKTNPKKIAISSTKGITFVEISDIIRCESNVNYTNIFLKNKVQITVPKTLKDYEELLSDYNFFRVHNSSLVNIDHVEQYIKEGGHIVMSDGVSVEVSRSRKKEFMQRFKM